MIRQERIRLSIRAIVLGVQIEEATAEKDVITTTATITATQPTIAKSTAAEIETSHTSSSSQTSFSHTVYSMTSFSSVNEYPSTESTSKSATTKTFEPWASTVLSALTAVTTTSAHANNA